MNAIPFRLATAERADFSERRYDTRTDNRYTRAVILAFCGEPITSPLTLADLAELHWLVSEWYGRHFPELTPKTVDDKSESAGITD